MTCSTMSSMLPYRFFFIPLALVEIQPAQRGKLDAVGLVPRHEALEFQLPIQLGSRDSSLNAGAQILFVDPLDFVHPPHIQGDDHPGLAFGRC